MNSATLVQKPCHFEEGGAPKAIRLHFVRDEVIAA